MSALLRSVPHVQAHSPASPPAEPRPESSRYTPIAQIDRGGMAEVILAEMRVGQGVTKLVALKRMWPDLASDPEFIAMFVHEARLSARMNHPNLVQTYEVFDDAQRPTIAMEYLDGQPLTRILQRLTGGQSLDLKLRLRILTDVLAALDYAHELHEYDGTPQGVLHRDVNPQNVFVTYAGQVKLLDFGVAKSAARKYQTRPGSLKGKLAYMAPEQILGRAVDKRADLFAVGVMLWEIVASRRLWHGMTEGDVVRRLASGLAIPGLPGGGERPRGLARICSRALQVNPTERYQSASEFAAEIESLLSGSDDAHRRQLGRAVAQEFAKERADRRALIARHMDPRAVGSKEQRPEDDDDMPTGVIRPLEECSIVGATWESLVSGARPVAARTTERMNVQGPKRRRPLALIACGTIAAIGSFLLVVGPVSRAIGGGKTVDRSAQGPHKLAEAASHVSEIVIAPISKPPLLTPLTSQEPLAAPTPPVFDRAPAAHALWMPPALLVTAKTSTPAREQIAPTRRSGKESRQPRQPVGSMVEEPVTSDDDDVLRPSVDLSTAGKSAPASPVPALQFARGSQSSPFEADSRR